MEIPFFIKGFLIGFTVAAPLGPIGIISLQRTFSKGYLSGLFSGLGISTADAVYGSIAAFGVTAVSGFLVTHQLWFRIIGGIVISAYGIRIYGQSEALNEVPAAGENKGCLGDYFSTLLLTLMNPALIVSFAAIFTGLGLVDTHTGIAPAFLAVTGIFSGSAVWRFVLSGMASRMKSKFTGALIRKINRVSGALILGFGIFILASSLFVK